MKFSFKDFFSKCDQIRRKLQIWSHILKKSLMENFIFCAVRDSSIKIVSFFVFSIILRFLSGSLITLFLDEMYVLLDESLKTAVHSNI